MTITSDMSPLSGQWPLRTEHIRLTIDQQIAEGDWVVTRVTVRATRLTDWLGMSPTGRPLTMTSVNVDRILDGQIVHHGGAANLLFPFLEIGAVRVVGPGEEGGT